MFNTDTLMKKKQQKKAAFNKVKPPAGLYNFSFGVSSVKSLESFRMTKNQLQALHTTVHKQLKKSAKIIFLIFPYSPITNKPKEIRMGKGKGAIANWAVKIRPGQVLFEICSKLELKVKRSLKKLLSRVSMPLKIY